MQKELLLALSLTTIAITTFIILTLDTTPSKSEIDSAVSLAKRIYAEMKTKGWDFSQGPCLTNALRPGWVLDIAHSPRLPIDDLPENQCPSFREDKAKHFVELDIDGNLIRAR